MCLEGDGRWPGGLAALGAAPVDTDRVINTHLHGDHCGGNTCLNDDGDLVSTFLNELYDVQRTSLSDAMFPKERTRAAYKRENFEPVERAGQMRVLWGDVRPMDKERVQITPRHTPPHQSVVLESGGEMALFLADAHCTWRTWKS